MRTLRIGISRIGIELRSFSRSREAVFFTFAFPLVLLFLFGTLFSEEIGDTGVYFKQYFIGGIVASGIVSVAFQSLAISIGLEQNDGTIKRLAATPLPLGSYFIGKIGMLLGVSVVQTAIMVVAGIALFDVDAPATLDQWITFAWVFLLGATSCTLLGIAYSRLIKSPKSSGPVTTLPFVVLQFISGVFVVYDGIPPWLRFVADLFPLRWMALGFRSVFLPDSFAEVEPGGGWQHSTIAIVLGIWCVVALAVSLKTFAWRNRES
jgi:ABC-2 type transport system permease protein